tara:strand:- start:237 stop:1016 length:780 start_codon:yes stop_codon:yes gene_type:complete
MKYVRSLLKNIYNSNILVFVRNRTGIRPTRYTSFEKVKSGSSISDAFLWRTDQGYETKFKFTDLPKLYFNDVTSQVKILIYSNDNKQIKKIMINNIDSSNELIINKKLLEGLESYGTFYVFHSYNSKNQKSDISINNRCYTGYSKNGCYSSFVHGNLPALYETNSNYFTDIVKNTIFKNQNYVIQNNFSEFDYTELLFCNPTSEKIYISVNQSNFYLNSHSSKLIKQNRTDKIHIKSNCYFVRPVIFTYKGAFYDVYHS